MFRKFLFVGLLSLFLPVMSSYAKLRDGASVATALNERFANVVPDCDGNPAFYCSGILIRTNEKSGIPTWKTYVPGYLDSLQFSFLRKDIGLGQFTIFGYSSTGFGIIIIRNQDVKGTRCFFPMNAVSIERKEYGCGDEINIKDDEDADNSNCKEKGITTAEEWKKLAIDEKCSFSTHVATSFEEGVKASGILPNNEFIINASSNFWSSEDPSKDNIQAFWYNPDDKSSSQADTGLSGAQAEQKLYYKLTQKWLPIVSVNVDNATSVFSYSDTDQAVQP